MIRLNPQQARRWLDIHGWTGITAGLLLYVVLLTGAIAVLVDEIGTWASPIASPHPYGMPPGVDAGVDRLVADLDPAYLELVLLYPRAGGRTRVVFYGSPTDADGVPQPRARLYDLDPNSQAILASHETAQDAIFDHEPAGALSNFYSDLHVHLHLPGTWGEWLVVIAALTLMITVITGFVVHGHLFKELFTLRRRGAPLLQTRDAHTVAGTWMLVFLAMIAVTGSYFSLHGLVVEPVLERVQRWTGPADQTASAITPVSAETSGGAARANLDAIFDHARERTAGGEPMFVVIEHWGRAESRIEVWTTAADGALNTRIGLYDGSTGAFLGPKPFAGTQPSLGGELIGLMRALHFGDFSGLASKFTWTGLGLGGAYVTLTGLLLWLRRREATQRGRGLERLITAVGYGLPCAMASAPVGFFLGSQLPVNIYSAIFAVFGAVWLLALLLACSSTASMARIALRRGTAVALVVCVSARWLSGGPGWLDALQAELTTVLALDLAMLVGASAMLWSARPGWLALKHPSPRPLAEDRSC